MQSIRITILGEAASGKTALIERACNGVFNDDVVATIGSSFIRHEVHIADKTYRLEFWDTAGSEKYHATIPSILKNTNAILLLYDINSTSSFEKLTYWVDFIAPNASATTSLFLVGNKIDLERKITYEDGKEAAEKMKAKGFFETSAKTGEGIDDLIKFVVENVEIPPPPERPIEAAPQKSSCC